MQTIEKKRPATWLIWGLIAVIAVLLFVGYHFYSHEAVEVVTAHVTHQDLIKPVSTNGKVEPVNEWQAHAATAGVVKKIYVDVGDKVKAGTLLISMDDSDALARIASATATLRTAESNGQDMAHGGTQDERIALSSDLERAQNQVAQAQKELTVTIGLQQRGAASANEVAAAQQRLQAAQLTLHSTQLRSTSRYGSSDLSRSSAQIADARAALAAAQSAYAGDNQRTTIDGTVYAIPVSQYDFVPAGDDLLDVADLNHIRVRAY